MAVAFDAAVSTPGGVNVSSLAWNHVVGDIANGILLIGIATGDGGASDGTIAPTVDGAPCTLLRFQESALDATVQLEIWYALAPSAGSRAISWNRGSNVVFLAATSRSYSGVNQADPFGAEDGSDAEGNPCTISGTVASELDGMVIDWMVQGSVGAREMLAAVGQTERTTCLPLDNPGARWLKTSDKTGAASVTMTWANTDGYLLATHYAVALNAASALPAPTISSIDPVTGAPAGGTPCTITGTGFVSGATVTFDGVAATGVTWVSATRIDCISPAHAAGAVDVVVTNPDTQTGTLAGGFTYAAVTLDSFEVLEESEAPLDDFRVGTAKNVLILAIGSDGQIFTDFTGTVEVTASGSNISAGSGTTAAFTAGELVHAVTFDQLATAITLGVADTATGTDTGTSAAFDVVLPAASAGGSALIGGPSPLIG